MACYAVYAVLSDGDSAFVMFRTFADFSSTLAAIFSREGRLERKGKIYDERIFASGFPKAGTAGSGKGYVVVFPRYEWEAEFLTLHFDRQLVSSGIHEHGNRAEDPLPGSIPLTWDGNAFTHFYLIMVGNVPTLVATRLTAAGLADGRRSVEPLEGHYSFTANAIGGTTLLVQHKRGRGSPYAFTTVRTATDPAALAAAKETPIEFGASMQESPAAASGVAQSLVAWRERTSPTEKLAVRATRIDADGVVLDPQSLAIGSSTCDGASLSVASNGGDFIVGWFQNGGVWYSFVRADGTYVTRIVGVVTGCLSGHPTVVSNNVVSLVLWSVPALLGFNVLATRVSNTDGEIVDGEPIFLGLASSPVLEAATNGHDFLVTWYRDNHNRALLLTAAGVTNGAPEGAPFGAGSVRAIWWNGGSYTILRRVGDTLTYQLTRAAGNGSITNLETPALAFPSDAIDGSFSAACDAKGCSMPVFVREGTGLGVSLLRFEDDDTIAALRQIPVSSLSFPVDGSLALRGGLVRGGDGPPLLVYTRRNLDSPYAGAYRVFLRTMFSLGKSRAVRH